MCLAEQLLIFSLLLLQPTIVKTWFTPGGHARGQAWGVYTFRGIKEDVVRPLRNGCKKEWRLVAESKQ